MIERVGVWLHVPAAASAAEHTAALLAFPPEPRWGVQAHRRSARKAARFKRTMTLTDITPSRVRNNTGSKSLQFLPVPLLSFRRLSSPISIAQTDGFVAINNKKRKTFSFDTMDVEESGGGAGSAAPQSVIEPSIGKYELIHSFFAIACSFFLLMFWFSLPLT